MQSKSKSEIESTIVESRCIVSSIYGTIFKYNFKKNPQSPICEQLSPCSLLPHNIIRSHPTVNAHVSYRFIQQIRCLPRDRTCELCIWIVFAFGKASTTSDHRLNRIKNTKHVAFRRLMHKVDSSTIAASRRSGREGSRWNDSDFYQFGILATRFFWWVGSEISHTTAWQWHQMHRPFWRFFWLNNCISFRCHSLDAEKMPCWTKWRHTGFSTQTRSLYGVFDCWERSHFHAGGTCIPNFFLSAGGEYSHRGCPKEKHI